MFDAPQIIDLQFAGRRHFFHVYRYTTDQELNEALHRDKITDAAAYEKGVIARTECYPPAKDGKPNEECGRMYLLDKSINTLAHEAAHMANGILARCGHTSVELTTDKAPQIEEDFADLIGTITSELYSQNKHF